MADDHEFMNDEELKRFFLNELLFFNPLTRQEMPEGEKLQVLYTMLKKINHLLELLYLCNWEMHYMEIYEVFGFYLVEKDGEKKKKHRMSVRLNTYGRFLYRLTRSKDLIAGFLLCNARQLDALERVQGICFPDVPGERFSGMSDGQNTVSLKEEMEK